jgi:hypothetical protein
VGASCTISAVFKPKAKGARSGLIVITDSAPDSPQSISLTGTGTFASLIPGSIDFGNQPLGQASSSQTIVLTNTARTSITIRKILITGTDTDDFAENNDCGSSLGAGNSCTINIIFTPTAKGFRNATLSVTDNAGGSPQLVALAGNGT